MYNRRYFIKHASKEIKRSIRFKNSLSIVIMDLDRLKTLNDTYGHACGDQALITFSNHCASNIREIDLLARYGGDEFVLALAETRPEKAQIMMERIRANLEAISFQFEGIPISLTMSVGIAGLSTINDDLDELLARADQALYRAKENGRNQVVLDTTVTQSWPPESIP